MEGDNRKDILEKCIYDKYWDTMEVAIEKTVICNSDTKALPWGRLPPVKLMRLAVSVGV